MTLHYNRKSEKENRRRLRREQTSAEAIVWQYLRNRKMLKYKFRRQYSIDKYVIDFYSPKLKFAVELDGEIHNEPNQKEHDEVRQEHLENDFAIRFIRIKNEEIFGNSDKAFGRIEEAIKEIEMSLKLLTSP